MALNVVTLTGSYQDGEESPLSGWLRFCPSAPLTDSTDSLLTRPSAVTVPLTADGTFSVDLLATDNAHLQPSGWHWTVTEYLSGLPPSAPWPFYLAFADGAVQDISGLQPAVTD